MTTTIRRREPCYCDVDTSAKGSATVVAGPPTLVLHASMCNGFVECMGTATFLAHYLDVQNRIYIYI